MTQTVLHIDSSARFQGSITRELSARIAQRLGGKILRRDLADSLPQINEAWVGANFTPLDQRDATQRDTLALSDALVAELETADTIVIGVPIYNFGVPTSLKAWIDLVARAGRTFRYSQSGPEGSLTGKRAILVVASGGTQIGSEIDFATPYLRHVLGFLGIEDVEIVTADRNSTDADAVIEKARTQAKALAA